MSSPAKNAFASAFAAHSAAEVALDLALDAHADAPTEQTLAAIRRADAAVSWATGALPGAPGCLGRLHG
jgi:hypothetical protein